MSPALVRLPRFVGEAYDGWIVLLELAQRHPPGSWALIGAQMVALHGYEHRRDPPRPSIDFDLLANVRAVEGGATSAFSRTLVDMGFTLDDPSPDGVSHRFRRGGVSIDVLAPDNLGAHVSTTTIRPARTVMVPGGTQALARSECVEVAISDRRGVLPRPSLFGAIIVKAHAVGVDDAPTAQERDLSFLLSLVGDVDGWDVRPSDRRALRRRDSLLARQHPAHEHLTTDENLAARRALRLLLGAGSAQSDGGEQAD